MAEPISQLSSFRFKKVHIEITNGCNLKCSFCPEISRSKKRMEADFFGRVLQQVKPVAEQVALHLMGEPLAHPQLAEIIKHCEDQATPVFFVTNGTLLRPDLGELLLQPIIRQVNFSLHSFPNNFPDRDPGEYLERIFLWVERAIRERPELFINFRLWNLHDPSVAGEKNRELLRRISERFGTIDLAGLDVRQRKNLLIKNRLYLHFDTEFIWPSLDLPFSGETGTCHGLSTHFGILSDGTVVPCCLDKDGAIALGNLEKETLTNILNGARAKKILRGFREGRLTEELCQRCPYIKRFSKKALKKETRANHGLVRAGS